MAVLSNREGLNIKNFKIWCKLKKSLNNRFKGCHPVHHIPKPSWEEFTGYQKAAGRRIIQITLAPEVEGAMNFF